MRSKPFHVRWRLSWAGIGLVALLPACNRGVCLDSASMLCSPIPPTPTPTRPPESVTQGTGFLPREGVATVTLSVRTEGTLSVIVDWTLAANTVEVYVARSSCLAPAFLAGRCDLLAASTNPIAKPKRLAISSMPAGAHTLVIRNVGGADESFAFDVALVAP
jgi:hypothetical protein